MQRKFLLVAFTFGITFALLSCSGGENESKPTTSEVTQPDTPVVLASEQAAAVSDPVADEHPLDKELRQCKDENPANLGVRDCIAKFLEKWDSELNRLYKELRNTPSETLKSSLKSSQLAWISFRDKEYAYIEAQFDGMEGSMYPNIILARKMNIVRARAMELYDYREFQKTME